LAKAALLIEILIHALKSGAIQILNLMTFEFIGYKLKHIYK